MQFGPKKAELRKIFQDPPKGRILKGVDQSSHVSLRCKIMPWLTVAGGSDIERLSDLVGFVNSDFFAQDCVLAARRLCGLSLV
jgi:hypothetical protein